MIFVCSFGSYTITYHWYHFLVIPLTNTDMMPSMLLTIVCVLFFQIKRLNKTLRTSQERKEDSLSLLSGESEEDPVVPLDVVVASPITANTHAGRFSWILMSLPLIIIIIMSVFLEHLSMWNMLNCAEQVQIQKYKTHAYKTLKTVVSM